MDGGGGKTDDGAGPVQHTGAGGRARGERSAGCGGSVTNFAAHAAHPTCHVAIVFGVRARARVCVVRILFGGRRLILAVCFCDGIVCVCADVWAYVLMYGHRAWA